MSGRKKSNGNSKTNGEIQELERSLVLALATPLKELSLIGQVDLMKVLVMSLFHSILRNAFPSAINMKPLEKEQQQKMQQLRALFETQENADLIARLLAFWKKTLQLRAEQSKEFQEFFERICTSLLTYAKEKEPLKIDFKNLAISQLCAILNQHFKPIALPDEMLEDGSVGKTHMESQCRPDPKDPDNKFIIDTIVSSNIICAVKDGHLVRTAGPTSMPQQFQLEAKRNKDGHIVLGVDKQEFADMHAVVKKLMAFREADRRHLNTQDTVALSIHHESEAPLKTSVVMQKHFQHSLIENSTPHESKILSLWHGLQAAVHRITEELQQLGATVHHDQALGDLMSFSAHGNEKKSSLKSKMQDSFLPRAGSFSKAVSSHASPPHPRKEDDPMDTP